MKIGKTLAAAAAALFLAQAAFAAGTGDKCKSLEARFDKQAATSTSTDLAKAKEMRAEGARLCSSGKTADGVKKLEEALKMVGTAH